MAWTVKARGKAEIQVEQQCAEPVHQWDQQQAMTSAVTGHVDLVGGDVLGVESPVEEPIVSPVVEAAQSEAAADLNVSTVVARSVLPVAEEHHASLVAGDRCALLGGRSAFPEAAQNKWFEAAAPYSVGDQSECSLAGAPNAEEAQ